MRISTELRDDHVGKFTTVLAGDRFIPVKIISVGDGLCGWAVLDPKMPLRSGKVRYNTAARFVVHDTEEEIMNWMKENT